MQQRLIVVALAAVSAVTVAAQGAGTGTPHGGVAQGGGQRTPPRAARAVEPPVPRGTAVLRGQVVALDTGAPVRRAQVRVSAQNVREARLATTDADGRFEVRELAAGRYTMTAGKGGFVTLQYGQRRPGESGTPLELADGQVLDKLLIGLPRGSVISGRVTDEFGEPVANAAVMALRYAYAGGARRIVPAGARDTTDDQGHYRLFGLPPGDYFVSASLRTGDVTDPGDEPSGYAPTYFPGTPNPSEAERVRLALAQENNSVSFGLVATRLVRVSGQVISSTGGPPPGGAVVLVPPGNARGAGAFRQGGGGRLDATGAFRLANVAPGRYQLQARTGLRGVGEFARIDITVGAEDVAGITLVTAPAGRVSGTVVTDTGEPLPSASQPIQVVARPATPDAPGGIGGGGGQGRISTTGAFELDAITDPRVIRVNAPQGWMLKAITLGGQDVTDAPLDVAPGQHVTGLRVVITQKVGTLTGMVMDQRQQPVLDATVVLFPADENLRTFQSRFTRTARPDQQGNFRITPLPPGDYLAVALQGLEDGQAGDPEFLAGIEDMAAGVALDDGEAKAMTLALRPR
jgi:Carboxypeptidase regulatory-like domain